MGLKLPPANASMLFGAAAALCIVLLAGLAVALFGDVTARAPAPSVTPPPMAASDGSAVGGARFTAASFADLDGWERDATREILAAWRRSCWQLLELPLDRPLGPPPPGAAPDAPNGAGIAGTAGDWAAVCQAVATLPEDDAAVRAFFAERFQPVAVSARGVAGDDALVGLFTGYYEPVLKGARTRSDAYPVPLYAPPDDLVVADLGRFDAGLRGRQVVGRVEAAPGADALVPFDSRGEIDAGALETRAEPLFWLADPIDALVLHIQGSGRIELPDGSQTRAGFAAHNGHPYRSIGRWLIDQGELPPDSASFERIRAWMEAHPERAAEVLAVNPRYIFFREVPGEGPIGAAGVPLTARRSLAVDTALLPLGVPMWIDAEPVGGNGDRLQRLVMAQDTGGAIKGAVRGDFYWGAGEGAGRLAGRTSSRGRYYLLLPAELAQRLVTASAEAELAN